MDGSDEIRPSCAECIKLRKVQPQDESVEITRDRCFLIARFRIYNVAHKLELSRYVDAEESNSSFVKTVIHVPGLRGNPQRTYPLAAVGDSFPGTFESYAA
ncbi:MAG: AAA family ATPase, partial [Isosphaeraceae bacterium]